MKNYLYSTVVIVFAFTGCKSANPETIKKENTAVVDSVTKTNIAEQKDVHVVLLAGQSNMAGAGNYEDLDMAEIERIKKVASRVSLSFNGKIVTRLSWYKNKPTEKYNFNKRFGPELFIGLTLAENNPNQEYLLLKRSQGGTALYGAWNPNWDAEKAKDVEKGMKQNLQLYNMHIEDIRKNIKTLEEQNITYRIIGLAWMQGENDAAREISATTYENNLKTLIKSYRDEFGIENMPFVIGQINSRYGKFREQGPAMVRKAMENVAASDKYTEIIKTTTDESWNDYPKHSDNVHYNAEGQRRLGMKFGSKLIKLNN